MYHARRVPITEMSLSEGLISITQFLDKIHASSDKEVFSMFVLTGGPLTMKEKMNWLIKQFLLSIDEVVASFPHDFQAPNHVFLYNQITMTIRLVKETFEAEIIISIEASAEEINV